MVNDFELPVVVFDSLNDALKSYLLNSGFAAFIPDQLMRKNIVDGWTHPAAAAAAATKSQKSQKPYFQKKVSKLMKIENKLNNFDWACVAPLLEVERA